MEKIDFALIGDGKSDACIVPILKWLLRCCFADIPINGDWADVSRFLSAQRSLSERIRTTIEFYKPDVLFVHRDAEALDPQLRYDEIQGAVASLGKAANLSHICVVPVRMTETWLLFDEMAIRKAAGNPNGQFPLELPKLRQLETIPDPKKLLFDLLAEASELQGRNRRRFKVEKCRYLITDNIEDYSPLNLLPAFKRLQQDIQRFADTVARQ